MINKHKNEKGVTLIEVLASVVILGIILSIFINVFIQSASINKTSENIVDATYIAQSEMERIYSFSLLTSYDSKNTIMLDEVEGLGYERIINDQDCNIECKAYKKIDRINNVNIIVKLETLKEVSNSDKVILEVYNGESEKNLLAKMENILVWGADPS